ncbi:DVUA0089 family protein [Nitratidesulfovibrio vulgaris]|uniref:DVUA0089 family protein n=1 Tax=Nitratidesulfovibrio vulgaris TaxID=881 RepID=UPI0022FFD182|nr:DVUA0089 family protein [Nitratidesulfovibrio vulgaris]WCB48240.1 DVUA0089 family protein [Nitratidesulfovibrio vulgaris]
MAIRILLLSMFMMFSQIGQASAAMDYDFFGNLPYHNTVLRFDFDVSTTGERTFFSSSWDDGGFDPMLGLWSAAGNKIEFQDDGGRTGSTASNGILYTHGNWDSYYTVNLAPGSYILTLSTYNNFNVGDLLSQGFDFDGTNPIPIASWDQPANGYRTSNYAFHILNVDRAVIDDPTVPTPEPSTIILMGLGFGALALLRRNRQRDV